MQKLLDIIVLAIATLAGYKTKIKDLQEQLATATGNLREQSETIATLKQQHEDDELDDEKLEEAARTAQEAADAAKTKLDEFTAGLADVDAKADELKGLLNDEEKTPSVDGEFNVTAEATNGGGSGA